VPRAAGPPLRLWKGVCRDAPCAGRGILLPTKPPGGTSVDALEIRKLEAYMRRLFGNARLRVVPRPKKDDSAEVYIGEEFIGVMFVDDEDEERSYNFQMAILGTDLN
jgi:hypothetical protein